MHADIVYSHSGYDVIIYFQSEVLGKNVSKIQHLTTLFTLSIMQCRRHFQICQVKHIGNVLD